MVKFVCYALRFVANTEARITAQEGRDEGSDEDDEGDTDGLEEEEEEDKDNNDNNFSDADIEQKELVVALWAMLGSDAGSDNKAQRSAQRDDQLEVLLNLLASFFFTITGDKLFSSRLVHFLAVLDIDSNTNCLCTAKNYL
ncbi:uncharacterized protein M421DRAFT_9430 [Didymella exigua CBS 183.55]|uniref:Uncharacterized protein n=1 Tax=Didymella exigua CBS 183.55 TaxID=1150837 RepID=A0A6A5R9X5_9PLEO|nr:uncharacterized protein M421DRAFT_9430 [Didymella exigua CBS 183.55]KAF1923824.1 hypothetical protein M421DRAFT_9430 [Didymella exigua CBS 183.55]